MVLLLITTGNLGFCFYAFNQFVFVNVLKESNSRSASFYLGVCLFKQTITSIPVPMVSGSF